MKINANIGGNIYPRTVHKTAVEYSDGCRETFHCISIRGVEWIVCTHNGIPDGLTPLIGYITDLLIPQR